MGNVPCRANSGWGPIVRHGGIVVNHVDSHPDYRQLPVTSALWLGSLSLSTASGQVRLSVVTTGLRIYAKSPVLKSRCAISLQSSSGVDSAANSRCHFLCHLPSSSGNSAEQLRSKGAPPTFDTMLSIQHPIVLTLKSCIQVRLGGPVPPSHPAAAQSLPPDVDGLTKDSRTS